MTSIAFFNNKGGVGKTTLVYHTAWMFRELGVKVVAVDLDPQSNLTAALVPEETLESLWSDDSQPNTILGAVRPLLDRLGDLRDPHVEMVADGLGLICGDLGLSMFEDRLALAWPGCLDDNSPNAHDAFRVVTSFHRAMRRAATAVGADVVVVDVGPNMGAINRAALIASDFVVVPLGADLFSLQGLRNLGPTLRNWRSGWQTRKQGKVPEGLEMPSGEMKPLGYIILQHAVRKDRPVKAYERWAHRIPEVYRSEVLQLKSHELAAPDSHELATLKHYRSLMPMAQEASKPIFLLKAADGAIGGHAQAVTDCYRDFEGLVRNIAQASGVAIPG